MSHNEDSKNSSKSDGASSDICIVDNGSANSSNKAAGWKGSSPSSPTYTLANKNINPSPEFTNTPSPIPSPRPDKPVSRLKRIILAPCQPYSPIRFNKEIKIEIEKSNV